MRLDREVNTSAHPVHPRQCHTLTLVHPTHTVQRLLGLRHRSVGLPVRRIHIPQNNVSRAAASALRQPPYGMPEIRASTRLHTTSRAGPSPIPRTVTRLSHPRTFSLELPCSLPPRRARFVVRVVEAPSSLRRRHGRTLLSN